MKLAITLLITLVISGCEVTQTAETASKSSTDIVPAPIASIAPTCAFETMTKNGSDALDPLRSNYSCKYAGQSVPNRVIHVFFANGAGRLQDPSIGPVEVTDWTLDTSSCQITVKVNYITRYVLTAPVLNSDGTLSGAGAYNQPNNSNRLLVECVFDATPGQAF